MASLFDRIDSALSKLSRQPWPRDSFVVTYMIRFEKGMDFLRRLVDCIHWSDDALGSPVTKIEASIEKIGGEFLEEMNRDKWAFVFTMVSFNLMGTFDERASQWIDVFQKLNAMIDDVKLEIAEAGVSFSNHSFQCNSPMRDFDKWKMFVKSIYLHISSAYNILVDDEEPLFFNVFLDNLAYDHLKNPKIEAFMIKVGSAAISAELFSCLSWSRNFDNQGEDIIASVLGLKQMFLLTNPEFVDVILGILKPYDGKYRTSTIIVRVVDCLVPFKRGTVPMHEEDIIFARLGKILAYFIDLVLNMPEEAVRMFLSDTKQLLMETASLHRLLYHVKDTSVARDLIEKVWLIVIEIKLRDQLTADNILKWQIHDFSCLLTEIKKSLEGTEMANQILMLTEEVAKTLDFYARDKNNNKVMVRKLQLKLLLKTLYFKAELLFPKLHDSLAVSSKDPIESLHDGLRIMIPFVLNETGGNLKDERLEFSHIEVLASRIISLYHLILDQNVSEEMLQNMDLSVPNLIDEIKFIMEELKGIYQSVQRPNFPKTNAVGFIDSLLNKLRDLLNYNMDLVESVIWKEQIVEIMGHLEFFQPFLEGISLEDIMSQQLRDLGTRVINLSHEVEYLIDSIMSGKEADWHKMIWRYHLMQDLRGIKIQVSKNQMKRAESRKVHSHADSNRHITSRATTPKTDEDVVSLVDQEELIIDRIIGGFEQPEVVSIVGMPGIGKTTLAKKVYNSPQVVSQFHIRAWCCVSETYRKGEVLLEILSHIIALTDDIMVMHDGALEFKLYQVLKNQKYLIVLDDVWNTKVLDDLLRIFPDDGAKNRILVTSRYHHVASQANPNAEPHQLRQLSDIESWKLLQKKIFHEEPCPDKLVEVGQKIAASCKGLPIAIVAMAGLLVRIERQRDLWMEIAQSLGSRILLDPEEPWRHVLELSYQHLPNCLKACFLYFGAFLEDKDIPAQKLMQLWMAEGFIPRTDFKSLEDFAEDYLMDLIDRSLVMLSQKRSRGGVKACRVHDVLRKLCQTKALEDNFLQVITRSNISDAPLHDLDYISSGNPSNPVTYAVHRLCFCSMRKDFIESSPSGTHVRSLLCFATGDKDPRCPYDVSFIFDNFRLLKVLDLECINMGNSFVEGILLLLQLRYLAIAGYIDSVPSSIANLWNLETFIVKGLRGKVNLPHTIWFLKSLRHVRVSDFAAITLQEDEHGNSSRLEGLITISSLFLPFGEETDNMLKKFPNLRKLKCISKSQNCKQFLSLEVLNQLESLKITYYGRDLDSSELIFPSNLKKLSLSNFRLPWDKISVIGKLPNLEVLKLIYLAFVGEEWEMVEGEFLKLKFLKLEDLDIAKWNANSDHLPKLEQLVLRSCKNLEIPVDIVQLPTLQMIDVQWCGVPVENSAKEIRKDGDEMLKVFINFTELQLNNDSGVENRLHLGEKQK